MATQIELDAFHILKVLAEWSQGQGDTQQGRYTVEGNALFDRTKLQPDRINDAIEVLSQSGHVYVERWLGTSPFSFGTVELTASGRLAYQKTHTQMDDSNREGSVTAMSDPDRKKVFIIHGRNINARIAVEHFLKALDLQPIDFDELAAEQGGTAFIGDIVRAGIRQAHAIIALFTSDEYASLRPDFRGKHDKPDDIRRWQARPNVIFEAGMAYGFAPTRTLLVTLGTDVALFSDVGGVHIVRLTNSVGSRAALRHKLIGIKCDLDERTTAWTDPARSGDFEVCVTAPSGVAPRDPF